MSKLLNLFNTLDNNADDGTRDKILRAPFPYPGGKSRSVKKILPLLPYRESYIEPFGGSAAVLLARNMSPLEVFNDRYAGVVAFYQCMRSEILTRKLCDWLDLTIHAREEFINCKESWSNVNDPIERAGRWYYSASYSFSSLGRNYGRAIRGRGGSIAGKIKNRLPLFADIHQRFVRVQVENQDWKDCIADYDHDDAVFYLDPPYVDAFDGIYKSTIDHRELLDMIFEIKGFVAVSGYSNPLYEENEWDDRYEWDSFVTMESVSELGNKDHITKREHAKEVLWIKE